MKFEKITRRDKRRYDDACGTAHALDLIGERWALLVMRELFFGPKRFSDMKADLPGISANVLTQRLEGLEATGVVRRLRLPPPASAQVYDLTDWGRESEPIFQTLGRWAARSPAHDPTLPISATSLMLSFRTMLDASRAGDMRAAFAFRMGAERFLARIVDGTFTVGRDESGAADVTFEGPARVIGALVYGGVPAEALPALAIRGDQALARRFVTLFPLPEKLRTVYGGGDRSREQ
jgi:DNA-binding HxlR family transcriptional regulator